MVRTSRSGAVDYMGISLKMTNATFGVNKQIRERFRLIAKACLKHGVFPKVWKRDNIMFIYKNKGDRMDTANWRPITIAPSLGKHLEKVMCYAVRGFDDRNGDNHAYTSGKSCMTAIIAAQKRLLMARRKHVNGRKYKFLSFISAEDIKSAFESVDHKAIARALRHVYGDSELWRLPELFLSYLDRRAWVIDKVTGKEKQILKVFGWKTTPQGSLVSPFLWRIYDGIFTRIYKDCLEELVLESGYVVDCGHISYADDHLTVVTIRVAVDVSAKCVGEIITKTVKIIAGYLVRAAELVGCGINSDKSECVVPLSLVEHVTAKGTKDHFK